MATFEFYEFGKTPMARILYPNGRVQEIRREKDASLSQPGYLYTDKHQQATLGTMTHAEARKKKLAADEWNYDAQPGEIAGHIY